jgi:FolB domain-containing protein
MDGRDRILIRDLLVRAVIGLNDWERETSQDVLINLTIWTDAQRAGRSDDVADALNYRTLAKAVIGYTEASRHFLVEALATGIARLLLVEHGAERVLVRVDKPGALRFARSVGVEIERVRSDFE